MNEKPAITSVLQSKNKIKIPIQEKRILIKKQLLANFPQKTVLFFGISFIIIGFIEIGLQVVLIVYRSVCYQIGKGIWAGFITILDGLLKLNLYAQRTYTSLVLFNTITFFTGILTSLSLVVFTEICARQFPCKTLPDCTPTNQIVTEILHFMAHLALIKNIMAIIFINYHLFHSFEEGVHRLGFVESFRELKHVLLRRRHHRQSRNKVNPAMNRAQMHP